MKKDVNVSLVQGGKLTRGGWLSIVSFLLVAVIALSVSLGFVVKSHKEETSAEEVYAGGGTVVNTDDTEAHGLSFETVEIAPKVLSSSGVAPILAENSYEIHASYNTEVGIKDLRWTWAWKDGSSGKWGNGKDVSTYVDFKVSTDTLTLTASVKQAFGEQIVVTAKNVAVPDVTKSATFDYAKRVTDVLFSTVTGLGGSSSHLSTGFYFYNVVSAGSDNAKMTVESEYTYSDVYSIEDTFSVTKYELFVNPTWVTYFKNAISGNELYTGTAKTVIDAIDTTGKKVNVGTSIPDITVMKILFKQLFGSAYTSSTELDNTLRILLAVACESFDVNFNPAFGVEVTVTGKYSSFTTSGAVALGSRGFVLRDGAFGAVAEAGSLEFDSTSKVF